MVAIRNAHEILVGNPEGKRQLGRPSSTQQDNIKIDLKYIGFDLVDWNQLAQDSVKGGCCEHGNGPSGSIKVEAFLTS
jgi:hypothetical protein